MLQVLHSKLTKAQERYVIQGARKGKRLGSGCTAQVVTFGKTRAVRIQESRGDYQAGDALPWQIFCTKSRSKHVPKVDFLAIDVDEYGHVKKMISVMERLTPAYSIRGLSEDDAFIVADVINDYDSYHIQEYTPEAKRRFPLKNARRLGRQVRDAGIHLNDLHDGNWMIRKKDGRLVITDPIC